MPYFIEFLQSYMRDNKLNQAQLSRLIEKDSSTVCNYLASNRQPNHEDFKGILEKMFCKRSKLQNLQDRKKALIYCYWGS